MEGAGERRRRKVGEKAVKGAGREKAKEAYAEQQRPKGGRTTREIGLDVGRDAERVS